MLSTKMSGENKKMSYRSVNLVRVSESAREGREKAKKEGRRRRNAIPHTVVFIPLFSGSPIPSPSSLDKGQNPTLGVDGRSLSRSERRVATLLCLLRFWVFFAHDARSISTGRYFLRLCAGNPDGIVHFPPARKARLTGEGAANF